MLFYGIFLLIASVIAGTLSSVVGMASVILYPALLFVGLPPIMANVTITVGIIFSGTSAVLSSKRELKGQGSVTLHVMAFAVIGAIIGSIILLHSSNKSFQDVAPFVILLSGVLMLIPKKQSAYVHESVSKTASAIAAIAIVVVGIYVGYFGAGGGVLMAAILIRIIDAPYAICNAVRNVSTLTMNAVSALIFIFTTPISWSALVVLAVGLFIGGYIGPIIVRVIPSAIMKYSVAIGAIILAAFLAYQAYF